MPDEQTYWNGEPCVARKVRGVVADDGTFPAYWARSLVGQERNAVEVIYGPQVFYLDDEEWNGSGYDGCGWAKVTHGKGSPRYQHRNLTLTEVRDRDA